MINVKMTDARTQARTHTRVGGQLKNYMLQATFGGIKVDFWIRSLGEGLVLVVYLLPFSFDDASSPDLDLLTPSTTVFSEPW